MPKKFKNELEPKYTKQMKSPWDFTQPEYDQRSSCYVNAGSHYGVGYRQPVGKESARPDGVIPKGKGMGLTVTEVPVKNLIITMDT